MVPKLTTVNFAKINFITGKNIGTVY